jgi:hypothetical protein
MTRSTRYGHAVTTVPNGVAGERHMHIYEYSIPSPSHFTRTDNGLLIDLGPPAASRCHSSTSTPHLLAPCPEISTSIPRSRNMISTMSSLSRRSVRTGSSSGHTPYVSRSASASHPRLLCRRIPCSVLVFGSQLAYSRLSTMRQCQVLTPVPSPRSTPSCCGRGSRPTPRFSGGWGRLHGRACRTCWNGQRRSAGRLQ